MGRKKPLLSLIFLLIFVGGAILLIRPRISPQKMCEIQGGRWGKMGLSLTEECNLPTKDGGEACSDGSECEGYCLADLSDEDWEKAVKGTVKASGRCSEWKIEIGCLAIVHNGEVNGILCVD